MIEAGSGETDAAPAVYGRRGGFRHPRDLGVAAEGVDDQAGLIGVHDRRYSIIEYSRQAVLFHHGNFHNGMPALQRRMDLDDLRRRIKAKGLTQAEIGLRLKLTQVQVSKSLAGTRRFTVAEMDQLRAMLDDRPGVPMRSIPVIGMVAAGNWREAIQQPHDVMPAPDPRLPPRAFGLEVIGDSMDLLVEEGGFVVVDPDDRSLFPDRYYVVVNAEGETTFKQFKADPARLVPCSTNPAHGEIAIGGEPFEVIGRVIWRSSRM